MATFRKVGNSWRVEVRRKGEYYSNTFKTKSKAKVWADQKEEEINKGLGKSDYTLLDALSRYGREVSPNKKGGRWEKIFINVMSRHEMAAETFRSINRLHVMAWRDNRSKKVTDSTVRREMALLSSVFQMAIEWGWTTDNPVRQVKRPSPSKPRDRRPSDDEIERVLNALAFDGEIETKQHEVAVMFLLAIESAMRLGEMCSLKPENIHLKKRYVSLIDTKNGTNRDVPLSNQAVALLKLAPNGFAVEMEVASALFRKACKRAKIDDLHFHDSRREGLTRLSNKVDVMTLAKISGHKDLRTLLNVYYAPTATDMAKLLD